MTEYLFLLRAVPIKNIWGADWKALLTPLTENPPDLTYLFYKGWCRSTQSSKFEYVGQAANKSNLNASLIHPRVGNPKDCSFNSFA